MRRQRATHGLVRKAKMRPWSTTDVVVEYQGDIDLAKDRVIRKALGRFSTGSGYSFVGKRGSRDFAATIPDKDLVRVLAALKKIRGIRTRRLVSKWVVCR